ncbi:MAG: ATP-binding protein [Deltaproteobacteria bacterium]|nr:ATP-binding protein [Deltaproteobacteria bacterium]
MPDARSGSLLAPFFAQQLYALRTSRIASDRQRWRSFTDVLSGFPTLSGATVSIEAGQPPELVLEYPGRVVLGLDELSSGEQEIAALTAAVLLAKSSIVAVEEPELGLDVRTQDLWRRVCDRQRDESLVHQFIFESHAPTFDGARVVRFSRDPDGWSRVEDVPTVVEEPLSREAREKGAEEVYVSKEGFTRLPEPMRAELGLGQQGTRLWFLRGAEAWEAWPEQQLATLLAEKGK